MRVVREHDLARFVERVGAHLEAHVAENNLILGLLADLARYGSFPGWEGKLGEAPVLLIVEGERGVESVAMQTPPRGLVLTRGSEEATAALVEFAAKANLPLPGVIGPEHVAERFASMWGALTGRLAVLRLAEMVYELAQVTAPAHCRGALREAEQRDETILADWIVAFTKETGVDPIADGVAFVRAKMSARQLFVWEDGAPVSMAAWGGRTVHGARLGFVYTPPSDRKKGFASAVVAALSERLIAEGCPRCFLFTNAANPTSNKIYQALGYRFVCHFRFYDFLVA
jgi:predicted GNAT family acetyltransferase